VERYQELEESIVGRFERISNQRIYQQIVDQISRMIRDGSLKPGDRLPPERQLAEEFGVSRPAVREALTALGMMGLVEVRPGEGTFVRNVTEEGFAVPMALVLSMEGAEALEMEVLEIRAALEGESAYLAAKRREPEDLVAIENAVRKNEQDPNNAELGAEADWEFHRAIAAASGNALLLKTLRTLSDNMQESMRTYRERLLRFPSMGHTLLDEHRAILEAIREQNPPLARDRMRAHIEHIKRTLYGDGVHVD
jgi:GntR family transcriptional repressor for pyruvate dehydrogenase complex